MKIAVIGAGAIGNLVAGYMAHKGADVSLIVRKGQAASWGGTLRISGCRGEFEAPVKVSEQLGSEPDIAVLATKTQDIEEALAVHAPLLRNSILLTTQNGVRADHLAGRILARENIVSSIVMFGATYLEQGHVVHNFEGSWVMGRLFPEASPEKVQACVKAFGQAFPAQATDDLAGMKYLKIFVNANNCIPAILGKSMQESFADLRVSEVSIRIWQEGLAVVRKVGIPLVSLPNFPLENITRLAAMPAGEAAKVFSGLMAKLSKEPLYGSILQSIKRGKSSEIDYINGEFVRIAESHAMEAPLNKRLVELVHGVEKSGRFLTAEEFLLEADNG